MFAIKACFVNMLVCAVFVTLAIGECSASGASAPLKFMVDIAETYERSSFSGEFVTTKDTVATRFRVSRWFHDGKLFERLDRLGADDIYTVLRLDSQIINIYPGKTLSRMQLVHQVSPLEQLRWRFGDITSFYQVSAMPLGDERVSGRPVEGVRFTSLDNHRYDYAIWVDSTTHVPLKFEYSWEGQVLETTEFLEFTADPSLNSTFFEVPAGVAEVTSPEATFQEVPGWRAAWLPPGFRPLDGVMTQSNTFSEERTGVRRSYGDGIATISVFVQPMMPVVREVHSGMFRSGALSMVSLPREVAGKVWQITALGEAPPLTLRMISMHVEFAPHP